MAARTWHGGKGETAKAEEKVEGHRSKERERRSKERERRLVDPWKHSFIFPVPGVTLALNTIFCTIWTLMLSII